MKKFLCLALVALMSVAAASARDKVYRDAAILPSSAQKTLKQAFPKVAVNHVKVDTNILGKADYDVVLNNGTEIEFNSDGDWKEVDCGNSAVPAMFVLKPISNYVNSNYKGAKIVQINKDRNDYEVELSNGVDLKFDRAGKFLRIDD